jgi:hypothetical protein
MHIFIYRGFLIHIYNIYTYIYVYICMYIYISLLPGHAVIHPISIRPHLQVCMYVCMYRGGV